MTNHKSNLIFWYSYYIEHLSSDSKKLRKYILKKIIQAKNLINLRETLELGVYTDEIEVDQLTLLCDSKRHQGVACELNDTNLSTFNLENYLNLTESRSY